MIYHVVRTLIDGLVMPDLGVGSPRPDSESDNLAGFDLSQVSPYPDTNLVKYQRASFNFEPILTLCRLFPLPCADGRYVISLA